VLPYRTISLPPTCVFVTVILARSSVASTIHTNLYHPLGHDLFDNSKLQGHRQKKRERERQVCSTGDAEKVISEGGSGTGIPSRSFWVSRSVGSAVPSPMMLLLLPAHTERYPPHTHGFSSNELAIAMTRDEHYTQWIFFLTLCRVIASRKSMSIPLMIASTMIQVATLPSGILPWKTVCTVTPSGLYHKDH
jgi:hypothetical protein